MQQQRIQTTGDISSKKFPSASGLFGGSSGDADVDSKGESGVDTLRLVDDGLAGVLASPYPQSGLPTDAGDGGKALGENSRAISGASIDSDASSMNVSELPANTSIEKELKKLLRTKNEEIERLNAECLELEDQVGALRKEVESAWQTYKQSQELAAERESDLQDEIKLVQKAKQTDKQQLSIQMGDASRELDDTRNLLKNMQADKDVLQSKIDEMVAFSNEWSAREAALQLEVDEARKMSFSGASGLQEQLRVSEETIERLRTDHSALYSKSQSRVRELESVNAELTECLTEKQRELDRLLKALSHAGSEEASSVGREVDGLRQQLVILSAQLEEEQEKYVALESKLRQKECETRASELAVQDERLRNEETISALSAQAAALEDRVKVLGTYSKLRTVLIFFSRLHSNRATVQVVINKISLLLNRNKNFEIKGMLRWRNR